MYFESEKINLNNLKFFIVAAESKSITEVSEKLEYSPSSVSTNLSTLESQLGVKLLYRDPLKTTEIGEKIYKIIKKSFRDIEFASKLAQDAQNLENSKILIGCQSHILNFFLMDKIEKALKDYKNLKIELDSESSCQKLMRKLKDNRLEFALVNFIPTDEDLKEFEIKEIYKSEYIFISNKKIIIKDLQELNNYNFAISYDYRSSAVALRERLKDYDIELNTIVKCPSMNARIGIARKGIAIAYVLKDVVQKELDENKLFQVELPIKLPESAINLVYLKEHLTTVDKVFIKEYLAENL